ncbi:MAG: glutamine synthetase III [Solitalea-like symbiont of Acarus siro]
MGATHYTHWFQPLTEATAEKHDSFFELDKQGVAIELFSAQTLIQQEPDASSFPSGGLRNTFEARGYTAWDPSSPAFILEYETGSVLCIPTIFVSYNGEALDYKAPLLKSISSIDKYATEICKYFDKNIERVNITLGIEQEYFLIDEALYYARPDLVACGRCVLGYQSSKGQQLEDHYFGAISERIFAYMTDLEYEAYKLGIPLKMRHNEVAPSQFECAPMFEEINLAIDHNQLLMTLMDKIAQRHKLKVLLHEKPFKGLNGSGKHNNWSLITNTGINLLSPGKTTKLRLQFLTFLSVIVKAVNEHADILRASIASSGNEHRLGSQEAPPAIISIFLGKELTNILHEIETSQVVKRNKKEDADILRLNIPKIPELFLDNTDRNRTSPFAFTGNKFEFRAVGSAANSASPRIVLNTIVANQLKQFKDEVDKMIKKGEKKEVAILRNIRNYVKHSKNILFEGNGYSKEWEEEAARRNLPNIKCVPEALKAIITKKAVDLFEGMGIYTKNELLARYEVYLEHYIKKTQIESRILGTITTNQVIPAVVKYQQILASIIKDVEAINGDASYTDTHNKLLKECSERLNIIYNSVIDMISDRKSANHIQEIENQAYAYRQIIEKYLFREVKYNLQFCYRHDIR